MYPDANLIFIGLRVETLTLTSFGARRSCNTNRFPGRLVQLLYGDCRLRPAATYKCVGLTTELSLIRLEAILPLNKSRNFFDCSNGLKSYSLLGKAVSDFFELATSS